jgi:hypothetical protein
MHEPPTPTIHLTYLANGFFALTALALDTLALLPLTRHPPADLRTQPALVSSRLPRRGHATGQRPAPHTHDGCWVF